MKGCTLSLQSSFGLTQLLIVGGGPIGIELAVACRRRGISHRVIEAGPIGNTISWWAPETHWFSSPERIAIAGVPLLTPDQGKATREQYLTYLRSVVAQFDVPVHSFERVNGISGEVGDFLIETDRRGAPQRYRSERVVLAIGGTDHPNRLNIPGEDLPHVDGYLRDPHRYYGRRVLILGGRNSAVEGALRLHRAGAHVSLSYRGATLPEESIKYWLLPEIKGLLKSGRIGSLLGTRPVEITPEAVHLTASAPAAALSDQWVHADDVLKLIGYAQDKRLFHASGVQLAEQSQRPVHDPLTMETNVPGIYVAGTAVAGTQNSRYKTFLENCHEHVDRILAHVTGNTPQRTEAVYADQAQLQPES
jgi:thioredoxin reductase (NADPH)